MYLFIYMYVCMYVCMYVYIYIYIYIYILLTVSLFRISIATLKMTHCDYDRFLNGNLIKSLDSYIFSSLSSLKVL